MTLETRIIRWIEGALYGATPKKTTRENKITDFLFIRYERILRLRELAHTEASRCVREGRPYSAYKLAQADRLLREITERLNSRPYLNLSSYELYRD